MAPYDPEEPSAKSGVHLIWPDTLIRPSYLVKSPKVDEATEAPAGFRVLDLAALVCTKLTSFRDIDCVHFADLRDVGLVTADVLNALPSALRARFEQLEDSD